MGIRRQERAAGRGGGFTLFLAAIGITAVFLLAGKMFGFLDFGSTEIDRSQPPLLVQLSDLAEYRAATSNFELVIDLENDVKFLPDLVAGERSVMVAAGSVDAKVDFRQLTEQNIIVSPDRKQVTVHLPAPEIADPRVDNERTEVVSRQRGVFTRIGGVFSDQPINDQKLYVLAEQKLRAAAQESKLRELAEKNTRSMLETFLRSLGFEQMTIVFDPPPSVTG
jgi:hypothetical protein